MVKKRPEEEGSLAPIHGKCIYEDRPIQLNFTAESASDGLAPYFRQTLAEYLKKWATLALKSSNPKEAQQFFIKNLVPIIENKRRTAFQINAAKDICSSHYPNYTFHLQFGELPIDKIWEYYKTYNHVTEEEYQKLLKLKEQNPTKFSRRWPVVFFKTDNKAIYSKQERQDEQPKTRKTLDI